MKSILIIDDSKTILETLRYTIQHANMYKPYLASSFAEAQSLIRQHQFYVAIVDLNLPDCNEGDAVGLTTSNNIPTIVLTGSLDNTTRKNVKRYPIVDYIIKLDSYSIFSSVYTAEALSFFDSEKILIVDISNTLRKQLRTYFEILRFQVVEATSAEEALNILNHDNDFKIILTELQLQGLDGISLIERIRKIEFSSEPIIYAMCAAQNQDNKFLALKNGAHDIFTKPVSFEELYPKIANALHLSDKEKKLARYVKTIDKYVITSETDAFGKITYVSDAFCQISGYTKEELLGKNHNIVRHTDMPEELYQELWATITSGKTWSGEVKNRCKNGDFYWVSVNIDPLVDSLGDITGYRAVRQDITDKKRVEELSLTDSMTGLYNRRHFNTQIEKLMNMGERDNKPVSMILLDVDHFKQYNDTYGHLKGDDVLISLGATLKYLCKRGGDVAYRLGGEEFCILSYNSDSQQAQEFANKLCQSIEELKIPHDGNSASDYVTASFGLVSTKLFDELDTNQLYTKSDEALYLAKEQGRNQVIVSSE